MGPQILDPYPGRPAKIGHFFFFFFSEISVVDPFFRKIFFLAKNFSTKNVSKNHEKFFGEQHNIKELSHKKFWVYTQQARKKLIFSIFGFFHLENTVIWNLNKNIFWMIYREYNKVEYIDKLPNLPAKNVDKKF